MTDDLGRRLVEYLEAVAWNGVRLAFVEVARTHPFFAHPSRRPLHVTCLGAGAVGGHAVRAATRYGDPGLREELAAKDVPGWVTVVDFDLTRHEDYLLSRLEGDRPADRRDPAPRPNPPRRAQPVDRRASRGRGDPGPRGGPLRLPRRSTPDQGHRGHPPGNLDRYVFPVGDPAWDELDHGIDTRERRLALSCYAWPGIDPIDCMQVYGRQIEPVLAVALRRPVQDLDPGSPDLYERAVARAELRRWLD